MLDCLGLIVAVAGWDGLFVRLLLCFIDIQVLFVACMFPGYEPKVYPCVTYSVLIFILLWLGRTVCGSGVCGFFFHSSNPGTAAYQPLRGKLASSASRSPQWWGRYPSD